jgi:hypothetical protein
MQINHDCALSLIAAQRANGSVLCLAGSSTSSCTAALQISNRIDYLVPYVVLTAVILQSLMALNSSCCGRPSNELIQQSFCSAEG